MYFEHFGLNRPPFEETTNRTFHFETAIHRAIIERIAARLPHGGIVLIKGDEGLGKSMLGQVLIKRFGDELNTLSFSIPPDDATGSLLRICTGFGLENMTGASSHECVQRIIETVAAQSQSRCLVLIDQAENLTAEDLLVLQRLVNESASGKLKLTIVLRARRMIDTVLSSPELRLMARQMISTPDIARLTYEEIPEYIATRLAAAGSLGEDIFTEAAIHRLAEVSQGVPRRINLLAKKAMIRAAGCGARSVDKKILDGCVDEFPAMVTPAPRIDLSPPPAEVDHSAAIAKQVDAAMQNLDEQVEQVVRGALDRIERVCSAAQSPGGLAAIAEDAVARLEQATTRADATSERIEKAVRKLKQVGETSEQRVTLLLNSLETAETIHDRLESVGQEVTLLVDESQNSLSMEHERLQSVVDQVNHQRTDFEQVAKELRQDRETALAEHRRIVREQLEQARESTLQAHREMEGLLAQTKEKTTGSISEIQDSLSALRADSRRVLADIQTAGADTKAQLAKVESQTASYDARLRAMSEAQAAATEMARQTAGTAEQIDRAVKSAHQAIKELESRTAAACRSKTEVVADLEEAGASAQNRIAEQLGRLESVVATEKDTRRMAEEAARVARTALAKATESEASLSRAQEAAINVESTATSALAGIQKQIKRVEESVEVVVNYGVGKARTTVGEVLDDAKKQLTASAMASQNAASAAQEEAEREVKQQVVALQTQSDAIADSLRSLRLEMESVAQQELGRIQETGAQAVEAHEEACGKTMDRVAAAEVMFGNKLESAKRSIGAATDRALEVLHSTSGEVSDQIAQRADETTAKLESAKQAIGAATDQALEVLHSASGEVSDQIAQRADETTAKLESAKQAIGATTDQALEALHSASNEVSDQITQHVDETATKLESAKQEIDAVADQAVENLHSVSKETSGQITQHADKSIAEAEAVAKEAITRIDDAVTQRTAQVKTQLSEATQCSLSQLERQAAQMTERAHHDFESAIKSLVDEASTTTEGLEKNINALKRSIAEAGTSREQIDHMLRDVWSLTTTTDGRVQSLEAIAENAEKLKNVMVGLLKKASTQTQRLNAQSGEAERSTQTMSAQHEKVRQICASFSQKIAEAAKVTSDIGHTTVAGKKLAAEMAGQISQLDDRLAAAQEVVASIQTEDVRTQETTARVDLLVTQTRTLEARLNELQRGLADPISRIQDAQAQAEELNGVCLAVKRVFRGVSQASLQAEERLKALARMLSAAKQTSKGIQQWVEEAGRARERLANMLKEIPSIDQTHPSVSMSDSFAEDEMISETVIDAGDRSLLLSLARAGTGAVVGAAVGAAVETGAGAEENADKVPASQSTHAPRSQVVAAAPINRSPNVMKRVESLADVLKAKGGNGKSAKGTASNRLQPEDVRALIEQANKAAVAKT